MTPEELESCKLMYPPVYFWASLNAVLMRSDQRKEALRNSHKADRSSIFNGLAPHGRGLPQPPRPRKVPAEAVEGT